MTFAKNVTGFMNEKDSVNAFCDGARKCASAARELAKMSRDKEWADLAETFELMGVNVYKLSRMKSMTKTEQAEAIHLKMHAGRDGR